MKRQNSFLLFLLLSIIISNIHSEDILLPMRGDYVYYDVNNKSMNGILGIAYFSDSLYRIRYSDNPASNIILDVNHSGFGDGLRITDHSIQYGNPSSEQVDEIIASLSLIMGARNTVKNESFPSNQIIHARDKYEDKQLSLMFEYWIPCLQLREIHYPNNYSFKLIEYGRMTSQDDSSFYHFQIKENDEKKIQDIILSKDLETKKDNGITYSIYENWLASEDQYGSRAYTLKEYTERDAYFLLERVDLSAMDIPNIHFFIKYYDILPDSDIIADTVVITADERPYIQYETFNKETMMKTLHMSQILDYSDGIMTLASLSVYKSLYDMNQDYFDEIMQSVY